MKNMMNSKNSKIAMNIAGTTLLACSTMAFVGANCAKKGSCKTKKAIKKTAQKIASVVDSVADAM